MLWTTGLRLFKIVYKEEIGNGAYGAVFTADYPFSGINDKGQEFQVLGSSFSRFRGLHFQVLGGSFASLGCFVFEFWVLHFRVLGASFSRFGCSMLQSSFLSASFSKLSHCTCICINRNW